MNEPDKRTQHRFWGKVDKSGECWQYTGGKSHDGYGQFWDGSRNQYAHRFAYRWFVGAIPPSRQLDHKCHVPGICTLGDLCTHRSCVNPEHLELVTSRANTLRGNSPSAVNFAKIQCPRGHQYTPDNTYRNSKNGKRHCRTCSLGWMKQYYWSHKS